MGVLPAEDMLPEVAYIKMMWILGHTEDPAKVRELFLTDIAGELNAVTDVRAFGQVRLPEAKA
jgi:glutamyl-tRNA(Gln) amidotransferase subunit D